MHFRNAEQSYREQKPEHISYAPSNKQNWELFEEKESESVSDECGQKADKLQYVN